MGATRFPTHLSAFGFVLRALTAFSAWFALLALLALLGSVLRCLLPFAYLTSHSHLHLLLHLSRLLCKLAVLRLLCFLCVLCFGLLSHLHLLISIPVQLSPRQNDASAERNAKIRRTRPIPIKRPKLRSRGSRRRNPMGVCHQACRFISLHGWRAVNHLRLMYEWGMSPFIPSMVAKEDPGSKISPTTSTMSGIGGVRGLYRSIRTDARIHLSTNEEQDVADSSRKAERFAFLLLQDGMICVGQWVEVLAHCVGAEAN